MSAAATPSWPGSRVLLGWWRALAARQPQQLLISRLLLHQVETLVRVNRPRLLDRWQRALLHLADRKVPCPGPLFNHFADLQIDPQLLHQLLGELTIAGLLHRNGSGLWQVTRSGRQALKTGTVSDVTEERRTFVFVDDSVLGRPPHFLPLERALAWHASPLTPELTACSFDPAHLEACLQQTAEWKARYRFPADVEAFLLLSAAQAARLSQTTAAEPPVPPIAANWQRVILDCVEARFFVFLRTNETSNKPLVLGFSMHSEGWALEPDPLLVLAEGWEEALPDLTVEPSAEMWRQAWREWSHPRSLPPVEVKACRLTRTDHRLLVHAPPRLIEHLRATRSDAMKQEAWLLAGEGRTRTAAQIELHPL